MVNNPHNKAQAMGLELKAIRKVRKLSLAAVAEPAMISTAYLQKLENGLVKNPSPRVLMRLAEVLGCEYERLMELVGYASIAKTKGIGKTTFLEAALRNEALTDDEQRAVLAFVSYLKSLRS